VPKGPTGPGTAPNPLTPAKQKPQNKGPEALQGLPGPISRGLMPLFPGPEATRLVQPSNLPMLWHLGAGFAGSVPNSHVTS